MCKLQNSIKVFSENMKIFFYLYTARSTTVSWSEKGLFFMDWLEPHAKFHWGIIHISQYYSKILDVFQVIPK